MSTARNARVKNARMRATGRSLSMSWRREVCKPVAGPMVGNGASANLRMHAEITRRWPPYRMRRLQRRRLAVVGERKGEVAELLDRGDDLVAGLQPHLLLFRIARDDAFRRAGEDDVAGLQRRVARDVAHQLARVEHHVAGVRRLAHLAVDAAFDLEVVAVGEIGADQPRPDRPGTVEALAQHPLARPALQVTRGEVVAGAVAEYVVAGVLLADVARLAPDHDHQFGLVVELLRVLLGDVDGAAVVVERGVVLVEQDRLLGHRVAGLGRVLAVVEADAHDLFRVGDAGAELRPIGRDEEALGGRTRARLVEQALEAAGVALAAEQRLDRGRRVLAELLVGGRHVEDAAFAAHAEAVAAGAPQRRQREVARQLLGAGRRSRRPVRQSRGGERARAGRGGTGERRGFQKRPAILRHAFLLASVALRLVGGAFPLP